MASRLTLIGLICTVIVGVSVTFGIKSSDSLSWRAHLIWVKLLGGLPEIPPVDFVKWLAPQSAVYLGNLTELPNVMASIRNPLSDESSVELGARHYGRSCASCHGSNGRGQSGPDLVSSIEYKADWIYFSAMKWGIAGTAMSAKPLTDLEIWQIHAYLKHLRYQDSSNTSAPDQTPISIDAADILDSRKRPNEWLTYAGNYEGHRHSRLSDISKKNIPKLQVAWIAQLRSEDSSLKASPIIAANRIFVTESPDGVVALDAGSGKKVWEFRRPVNPQRLPCCGSANQGVAILQDSVFVYTVDAHLVALDATTGNKKWEVEVAKNEEGYTMTGAPLAVGDRIIVGVGGGDIGLRGFIAAYNANDGHLLWKFYTVPAPGEQGHESWAGDSWKTGGAATWGVGAYDEELELVYWGVGNSTPLFSTDQRGGDNLFSNSVVALDVNTGQLRWHYQFTPADAHDWDSTQQPVLAEILWKGKMLQVLLWANRNGFFYVLDRHTGAFLFAEAFAKQTWAEGFTSTGRPIVRASSHPSVKGALVWPSVNGATNRSPPSYDPDRKLIYVPTIDRASIYFTDKTPEKGTTRWANSGTAMDAGNTWGGTQSPSIKAIEIETGKIRWQTPLDAEPGIGRLIIGGVLSTKGGAVFAGFNDEFIAFDSDTGRNLWRIRVGGQVNAPPVAFAIGQTQFIALIAGSSLIAFSLPPDDR